MSRTERPAKRCTLFTEVLYDDRLTDPEGLASALDKLLETAMSVPGILDEYGNPEIREFFVRPAGDRESAGSPGIPQDVADRLHLFGNREVAYRRREREFLQRVENGHFGDMGYEASFYDPLTGKSYQMAVRLDVVESEPPNEDRCPRCSEALADALDIPDDAVCEVCGWSRSGVRRCIRCGGRDDLVPDDAVCAKCRR